MTPTPPSRDELYKQIEAAGKESFIALCNAGIKTEDLSAALVEELKSLYPNSPKQEAEVRLFTAYHIMDGLYHHQNIKDEDLLLTTTLHQLQSLIQAAKGAAGTK